MVIKKVDNMVCIQKKGRLYLVKSKFGSFRQDNLYDAKRLKKVLDSYETLSLKNNQLK